MPSPPPVRHVDVALFAAEVEAPGWYLDRPDHPGQIYCLNPASAEVRRFLIDHWWMTTFPGLAIMTVSLAFNLLGDGLRDVLDPRNES